MLDTSLSFFTTHSSSNPLNRNITFNYYLMIIKKAIFMHEIIKQTMVEFFSFRIFSVFLVESIC